MEEVRELDLSQVVPYILAHARWIGLALLAVGIAVRLLGRRIAHLLLVAGLLATAVLAYEEWQAVHSLVLSGGIFLAGVVIVGLLAWTLRGLSFLFAFALVAAAFYLLLYGWVGPAFASSTIGSLTWAGGAILTMIMTGLGSRLHRAPVANLGTNATS